MATHVIGVDVSTTATKAIVIDEAGRVAGIGSAEYEFAVPQPLWSEQDPALWWEAAQIAIPAALADAEVRGSD
ncbi:MAG: FGGY family carbohydrate kinase, partial [Candidatus Limnocylindria bacterium]